jgi:membrane protein DedA with SNARE-associated domain
MRRIIKFFRQYFGPKEWAALAASIVLTILVTWLLSQTHSFEQFGYVGGFLAMLLGSATVILPAPGLAVVAALGTVTNPLLLGIVAGMGATLGEVTGYLVGYGGHKIAAEQKHYQTVERFLNAHGFWAIALLAFIPNPLFDIAGIIAGGTKYPFNLFLAATFMGKVAKCILIAYLGATTLGWLFN